MSDDKDKRDSGRSQSFWASVNPGYIVAGVATLVTSWLSIGHNFYKNLYENGVFSDLRKTREDSYKQVFHDGQKHTLGEVVKSVTDAEGTYLKAINERLKDVGVTNTLHRWKTLKGYQQVQIGLTVGTVLAIGIGAIVGYSRNQRLAEQVERHDRQITEVNGRGGRG